ncbi:MAG: succinate dehydrogenase, cytochrome b556 subunit [Ottowia sp.]|nr:succinate dehydrogenase, cytochrome b556 subunit [Ottowia sp.]
MNSEIAAALRRRFSNIHISKDALAAAYRAASKAAGKAAQGVRAPRFPATRAAVFLHRAAALLMFALLPLVVWLFDRSVTSEIAFDEFTSALAAGMWMAPGWLVRLACVALLWALAQHTLGGLRLLAMDVWPQALMAPRAARISAWGVMAASALVALLAAVFLMRGA